MVCKHYIIHLYNLRFGYFRGTLKLALPFEGWLYMCEENSTPRRAPVHPWKKLAWNECVGVFSRSVLSEAVEGAQECLGQPLYTGRSKAWQIFKLQYMFALEVARYAIPNKTKRKS